MPDINFLTISPIEGTGIRDLTITAQANTGRSSRTATYKAYGKPPYDYKESTNYLIVTQNGKKDAGKDGFIAEVTAPQPAAADTTAEHTFKSNFQTLAITVPSNSNTSLVTAVICERNLATSEKVALTGSGYAVKDAQGYLDPGEHEQYDISLTFSFDANTTQSTVPFTYTINGVQFSFIQAAAQAPQVSMNFTSSVSRDVDVSDPHNVTISLAASGAYADGDSSRQIQVVTTPATGVQWTIDATEIE